MRDLFLWMTRLNGKEDHMYYFHRLVILSLLVFAQLPAFAGPTELEPVVVTATRAARPSSEVVSSVSVITAEEIALSGSRNLSEVLKGSVGLHVTDSGTAGSKGSLSIRGSEAGQVLVLLDGVRLNSPQVGMFDLSNLPISVEEIERIEILRGPASALYGPNALGGVVQIFTREATREPLTRLSLSEGRFEDRRAGFSTSGSGESFRYRLGAARKHSNSFRDNSGFDENTLDGRLGFDLPGGFDVSVSGYHLDKDLKVPGPTTFPTPTAKQKDEITHVSLALTGPLGPLNVLARPVYSRHRNEFKDPGSFSPQDDKHILKTLGMELQGEVATESHALVVGGDFYRDDLDSTANGTENQTRWSAFGQFEYSPTSRLTLLMGLRYDAHSDFSNELSPRAGALLNLTDSTRLRVSGGRAYRAATLNDRFWPDTGWVRGNPDLDPETAWEYEVALDQDIGDMGRFTLAGFDRHVDDLIAWAPDQNGVWEPMNLSDARIWGGEAEVYLYPVQLLRLGGNYTYLHPQDRDTDEYIIGKLRHQANAWVEFGPVRDATLRLDGFYYYYYEEPQRTNNNFVVMNATFTKAFMLRSAIEMELTLSVKNVLDKGYEETPGFPMPPRQWIAGVTAYF